MSLFPSGMKRNGVPNARGKREPNDATAGTTTGAPSGVIALISKFPLARCSAQNIVVDWNAVAITAAGASGQNSLQQERSIAITSVAVSDAVNAISNEFTRYGSTLTPPADSSTTAAAAGAAYGALTQLLPTQTQFLSTMLAQSLTKFGVSAGDPGFVFGESVADEIVAMRSADGAALAQYS